jgi:hypothetical protein
MGWDPGPRPAWVEAVNEGAIEPIADEAARPLTVDSLLGEALALEGDDDRSAFGADGFVEPLRRFLDAVSSEAQLTVLGRWLTRRFLLRLLTGRIQQERYVAGDPGVLDEPITAPVVVAGAPRTGTTILHALLVQDPALRAPLGWELLRPVPPPPAPGYEDERVELAEAELRMLARVTPSMDAIHEYGARNPKECLSAMSFELLSEELTARYDVPSFTSWFQTVDMRPAYERHKLVLQIIQRRTGPAQWVLKSPVHLHNLDALLAVYPDARLAFTHRDPTEVLASATSLVANLRWVFSERVDYEGIGRYHVELFTRSLDRLVDTDLTGPVSHTYYADFLERPLDTVAGVYSALGLAWSDDLRDRMATHLAAQPQGRHGEHRYDFDDLGVDRATVDAGFARYVHAFHVPRRSVDHDDS